MTNLIDKDDEYFIISLFKQGLESPPLGLYYECGNNTLISLNPFPCIANLKQDELINNYYDINPFLPGFEKKRKDINGKQTAPIEGPNSTDSDKFDETTPHIFRFIRHKLMEATESRMSQKVIFRGCSGSGKTESLKLIIQYLIAVQNNNSIPPFNMGSFEPLGSLKNPFNISPTSTWQKALIASIMLFESLGSCITEKNRNTSRHLKDINLFFNQQGQIIGVRMQAYLTELLRFSPKAGQQNSPPLFFFQFLAGIGRRSDEYKITSNVKENYLNSTMAMYNYNQQELQVQFEHLENLVLSSGLSPLDWSCFLKAVAGCILLQCVQLSGSESTIITSATKQYVASAEVLFGLPSGSIGALILKRADERVGKPTGSTIDNKPADSRVIVDSACQMIYGRAFDYILLQLSILSFVPNSLTTDKAFVQYIFGKQMSSLNIKNEPTETPSNILDSNKYSFLELIDTPGWESHSDNGGFASGLVELLINYTNEKINACFIKQTFVDDLLIYMSENVSINSPMPPDTLPFIELFEKPGSGLLFLLEEQCVNPRGDDKQYLDKLLLLNNRDRLVNVGIPSTNNLSASIKSKQTLFTIRHTHSAHVKDDGTDSGTAYDCEGFVYANRNTNQMTIQNVLTNSTIIFISVDFTSNVTANSNNATQAVTAPPPPPPSGEHAPPPPPKAKQSAAAERANLIANFSVNKFKDKFSLFMKETFDDNMISDQHSSEQRPYFGKSVSSYCLSISAASPDIDLGNGEKRNKKSILLTNGILKPFNDPFVALQIQHLQIAKLFELQRVAYSYIKPYHEFYNYFRVTEPFTTSKLPLSIFPLDNNSIISANSKERKSHQKMCTDLLQKCIAGFAQQGISNHIQNQDHHNIEFENTPVMGNSCIFVRKELTSLLENYRMKVIYKNRFAANKIQTFFRMMKWLKWYKSLYKGIVAIQSNIKSYLQTKAYQNKKKCATLIKSLYRMHYHRKIFLHICKSVNILKNRFLGKMIARIRYNRLRRAVRTFQSIARGIIVRKKSLDSFNALLTLQRAAKKFVDYRRDKKARLIASVRLQSFVRGWKSRVKHHKLVQILAFRREQRIAFKVVQKLQSLWRGKLFSLRFQEIAVAVKALQRWSKARIQRGRYLKIRFLAVWLQRCTRRIHACHIVTKVRASMVFEEERRKFDSIYRSEITSVLQNFTIETRALGHGIVSTRK
eukprot:gene15369-20714_t